MFARYGDDVLFEVDEGGKLHKPLFAVELEGYRAESLTRGMCRIAGKTDVFGAEQTLGIARLRFFGASDLFGSLFGLGEIDGDDNLAARIVVLPLYVAVDVGTADIGGLFGEVAQPFRGFHTAVVRRDVVEGFNDFRGRGRERAHYARFEEQTVAFGADCFAHRVFRKRGERRVKVVFSDGSVRRLREVQHIQQRICGINDVRGVHMQVLHGVVHKIVDVDFCQFFERFPRRHKTSEHTHFPCKRQNAVLS